MRSSCPDLGVDPLSWTPREWGEGGSDRGPSPSFGSIPIGDACPHVFPEERKTALGGMLAALEAGDRGSQREFIEQSLFLPTDDAATRDRVVAEMCAAPAAFSHNGRLGFPTAKRIDLPRDWNAKLAAAF